MRRLFSVGLSGLLAFALGARAAPIDKAALSLKVAALGFKDRYPIGVQPGSSVRIELERWVGTEVFPPDGYVDVTWTVKMEGKVPHATIDQKGLLTVQSNATPGSIVQVFADLNHGERVISRPVYVYRPGLDPLFDAKDWRQTSEIPCDGSADRPVGGGIDELLFYVSGQYSVTWMPFESYKDYWGPYTINVKRRTVNFRVLGGNYVPKGIHGHGTFKIVRLGASVPKGSGHSQPVQLRLNGIYLGARAGFTHRKGPKPCGMVFVGNIFQP